MSQQEQLLQRLKAEAFDRVVEKYRGLQDDAGFYSKNWVELAELLEAEVKQIQWIAGGGRRRHDPSEPEA